MLSTIRKCKNNQESIQCKINNTLFKKLNLKWNKKNLILNVFDINSYTKKNAELLELKTMDIIKHIKTEKFDFVIFGIGYVDYNKILNTFNRANLIKTNYISSIHANLKKVNGQYISLIQQCILLNIPHFCLGRDRLTELSSIGSAIFGNPREIFSILYYFINSLEENEKKQKYIIDKTSKNLNIIAPNFYKAFIMENALYLIYNFHAKLLQVLKSEYYVPELNKNNFKKNKENFFFSFFKEKSYDQVNKIRIQMKNSELYKDFDIPINQKNIKILIICDTISVDYFFHILENNFSQWQNISPFYDKLIEFEKKSAYKYSLALFLFILAPISWIIILLIKYLYYLWVEYFTKGKMITVGGDIFFKDNKLIDLNEINENNQIEYDNLEEKLKKKNKNYEKFNILGGLIQWFQDKSRN